jgi:PAS domain S-box-containing protein
MLKGLSKLFGPVFIGAIVFLVVLDPGIFSISLADNAIKVGIFQNKPIVFFDEDGPRGLFVEVLDKVALEEKWQLDYVTCELDDCLKQLAAGELDLMTSLGVSADRLELFSFSGESVWTFWGAIYARDIKIQGILDLQGKVIGVRKNNNTTAALQKLLDEFRIPVQYVEFDNYEAAFQGIQQNEVDAVAVNNTYIMSEQEGAGLYRTPIVFNPFAAFFAAPKNGRHADKLAVIDDYVRRFKADEASIIHGFIKKWFGSQPPYWTTRKVVILSFSLLLLGIFVMALWRYRSLVALNRELSGSIAEQKKTEEALMYSEKRWRNIIVSIPQIGISLDRQGRIIFANTHFLHLVGWQEQEVIGRDWFAMFIPAHIRQQVRNVFITTMRQNDTLEFSTYENEILTRAGEMRVVAWSNTLNRDSHGNIVDVTCLGVDLTGRMQVEEEKKSLQAQLQQAQKMDAIGQLAGGVAHDFNNMLGVILGHTEMAMDHVEPSQPLYADLEEIRKAATRSADITRKLLAFARRQTVAPREIDLNETIEGMLKMLRRLIGEDVDLAWLPGSGLWPVKMDPSQVDQILANLCVNARGAIAGVGKITVETGNRIFDEDYCDTHAGFISGDYVRISVSDSGCGMDQETLAHIFEPFFTTKGVGEGTGLGLAMVYGAVKQNNGFINAYSEPGRGTTITLYLPRYAGETGQLQREGAAERAAGGDETILLVEDEPIILKMTTTMLKLLGYTVLAAATPGDAIRLASTHTGEIHLLLTDVIMPEMNGRDLAEKMLLLHPRLKCLFMSGYTSDVISRHGTLDEGVHFIQKPFTKKDLAIKVRTALEKNLGAVTK